MPSIPVPDDLLWFVQLCTKKVCGDVYQSLILVWPSIERVSLFVLNIYTPPFLATDRNFARASRSRSTDCGGAGAPRPEVGGGAVCLVADGWGPVVGGAAACRAFWIEPPLADDRWFIDLIALAVHRADFDYLFLRYRATGLSPA